MSEQSTAYTSGSKVTEDENAIVIDLKAMLKLMYNNHIKGAQENVPSIIASLSNIDAASASLSNVNKDSGLVLNSLDMEKMRTSYLTTGSLSAVNVNANVYYSSGYTNTNIPSQDKIIPYSLVTESTTLDGANLTTDLNCYNLLTAHGYADLAAQLREIKIAYQLLDDDIFNNLINSVDEDGNLSTFPNIGYYRIYDMILKVADGNKWRAKVINDDADYTANEKTSDTATFEASTSLVKFVRTLDPKTQDIFTLRRMLLGSYLAAHFNFFMNVFKAKKVSGSTDANRAGNLAFYFYNKLQKLNLEYESSMINTSNAADSVQATINSNVKKYKENTTRLAQLSTEIQDNKRFLSNEISRINAEKANTDKATKLKIATITLSVIFAVTLIGLFMAPFELKTRMKIGGVISLLIVIFAITMFQLTKNVDPVMENFAQTPVQAIGSVTSSTVEEFSKLMNLLVIEELRSFYRYTIDIALTLTNIRLYGELNYNSGKERNYFESSQYQLKKSVTDAKNMQRLYDQKTKLSSALIRLLIQLIVIVAFMIISVMAAQETVPALTTFIYVISAIFAVLCVIIFFADVIGRTRTDADKMYWGTPDAVKRL